MGDGVCVDPARVFGKPAIRRGPTKGVATATASRIGRKQDPSTRMAARADNTTSEPSPRRFAPPEPYWRSNAEEFEASRQRIEEMVKKRVQDGQNLHLDELGRRLGHKGAMPGC